MDNLEKWLEQNNFNSHAHVERDLKGKLVGALFNEISTHTLTWSVTEEITKWKL